MPSYSLVAVTDPAPPSYATVFDGAEWRPLPNCPGRMVLRGGPSEATPVDLVGEGSTVHVLRSAHAPDLVHVAWLEGGALLSYARPDGTFVHTLNTPEGLARKLAALGLTRP